MIIKTFGLCFKEKFAEIFKSESNLNLMFPVSATCHFHLSIQSHTLQYIHYLICNTPHSMYHLPGENCTATLASASGMNVSKTSAKLMDHAKINHELS